MTAHSVAVLCELILLALAGLSLNAHSSICAISRILHPRYRHFAFRFSAAFSFTHHHIPSTDRFVHNSHVHSSR